MSRSRLLKLRSSRALFALAFGACGLTAHADDTTWQTHGSFTQGVTYSSDNNFYGPSDDNASLEFTEINLNASARLFQNLRASGQVLYRHAGAQSKGGAVDYLFLDYQFFTDNSVITGVRGGRFKLPIGLYNETRDVAFTRPSIYLPQSVYPDPARDLALSADGALFYTNIFSNAGQWTLEFDAGTPRVDKKTAKSSFSFLPGEVASVGHHSTYGGRVMFQSSDGGWVAAFSRVEARMRYQQALLPTFQTDIDVKFVYWLASLQRNIDEWTFTGEYGHMDVGLKSDSLDGNLHPLVYYLQATRRLDESWSVYGRWDNLFWDRRDRSGNDFAAISGRSNFANFAHDYTFGVRFDFTSNMMVSAEYHYIDGTAWLSIYDNPDLKLTTQYWNMLAMEFSYRF